MRTRNERATLDAIIMLRLRVGYMMDTPTIGDCILMNAAHHLERKHAEGPPTLTNGRGGAFNEDWDGHIAAAEIAQGVQ